MHEVTESTECLLMPTLVRGDIAANVLVMPLLGEERKDARAEFPDNGLVVRHFVSCFGL